MTNETPASVDELRIVRNLVAIAMASQRADGTDIPLGQQCREAAAALEAQAARIEAMRGALQPFAAMAAREGISEGVNMHDKISRWLTVGQLQDASDALKEPAL